MILWRASADFLQQLLKRRLYGNANQLPNGKGCWFRRQAGYFGVSFAAFVWPGWPVDARP
ncbi:MAG: hypothetical protein R2854_23045 [Caldilineaceae bacterium]